MVPSLIIITQIHLFCIGKAGYYILEITTALVAITLFSQLLGSHTKHARRHYPIRSCYHFYIVPKFCVVPYLLNGVPCIAVSNISYSETNFLNAVFHSIFHNIRFFHSFFLSSPFFLWQKNRSQS